MKNKKLKFKVTFTVEPEMDVDQLKSWLINYLDIMQDQQCEILDFSVEP